MYVLHTYLSTGNVSAVSRPLIYALAMGTIGDRVRVARQAAGLTQQELAAAVGVNRVSVTLWEGGTTNPSQDRIAPLSKALKVSEEWIMFGRGEGPGRIIEAQAPSITGGIPVTGFVEAGRWFDVENDLTVTPGIVVPALGNWPLDWQRAMIVQGNSINRLAAPGDILVCLDLIKSGVVMDPDDLVIVERSRFDGIMVERTAKRVRRTVAGWELWPESTDPAFQKPTILTDAADHEEIRVAYKVIWIVRRP